MAATRIGDFEIIDEIGIGGMAVVYKARQLSLDRLVALKVPRPEFTGDAEFAARFTQEARHAARLNHPNAAAVYSTGEVAGAQYIAMEFVEGESLATRLARLRKLSPREAVSIALHALGALEAAHAAGIIHRDVTPKNILLDVRTGYAKLVDFGIARALGAASMTQVGLLVGAPPYMSPEQIQGGPLDGRSDLYSLGLVLYEMLTGCRPHTGDTPMAVVQRRLTTAPPAAAAVDPSVPADLSQLVARAMALDPAQRFQTAEEFRQALLYWRQGAQPAPAFVGPPAPAWPSYASVVTPAPVAAEAAPTPAPPAVPMAAPAALPEERKRGLTVVTVVLLVLAALVVGVVLGAILGR